MKQAVSLALHAHWDAIRAGRVAPDRDDVDPAEIGAILAHTFLLEGTRERPWRARDFAFRVSAPRLDALLGRSLRGQSFDGIWSRSSEAAVDTLMAGVVVEELPTAAEATGGPAGDDPIGCELLLLPLQRRDGSPVRVLGSLASTGAPSWMGLAASSPLDLLSVHATGWPEMCGVGELRDVSAPPKGLAPSTGARVMASWRRPALTDPPCAASRRSAASAVLCKMLGSASRSRTS